MHTQTALFHLHQLLDTSVRACQHVAVEKHPVLHVIRDADGNWYFLCGRGHRHDHHEGVPVPLKELVQIDCSLNAVSALEPHDFAERPAVDQPWTMGDQLALEIPECIEEHGWFVALVSDTSTSPANGFAYSIGMPTTLDQPEVIVIGHQPNLMAGLVNEIGARMKRGEVFTEGCSIEQLIAGSTCTVKPMHPTWYRDYLGYGMWYHGCDEFEVLQVFWTDPNGLFPWEEGCALATVLAQPDLSCAKQ